MCGGGGDADGETIATPLLQNKRMHLLASSAQSNLNSILWVPVVIDVDSPRCRACGKRTSAYALRIKLNDDCQDCSRSCIVPGKEKDAQGILTRQTSQHPTPAGPDGVLRAPSHLLLPGVSCQTRTQQKLTARKRLTISLQIAYCTETVQMDAFIYHGKQTHV